MKKSKNPSISKKLKGSRSAKSSFISKIGMLSLCVAFIVLILDQGSKYLVNQYIPQMVHESQWYPYNGVGIFEDFSGIEFSIVHAINRGAAWGLFSSFQGYLLAFRALFISLIFLYLIRYNEDKRLTLPLSLIVVGAFGNILDYFVYGHVIDMFHFVFWGHHFAIFNVADCAISIGVGIVILMTLLNQKSTLRSTS